LAKRSKIQPLDQHAAASLQNWKEENGEIAKLPDIFISRAKEDGSTGEYVVCLYTAHLAEIAKFFFVFAGISNIQGEDDWPERFTFRKIQDIFIFHKEKVRID